MPSPQPSIFASASLLVANGTNIRTVADLMGHATPGFTLAVYAHGSDEAAVAAVVAVEGLLSGMTASRTP